MPQVTLYAPAIHCEHCIETIKRIVNAQAGGRFLAGDIPGRRFSVEVDRWDRLDAVGTALAAEEYPLGEAADVETPAVTVAAVSGATHPEYRVKRSDAGAEVNYDCPCSCVAGFAFNRAQADQEPESCCCGRTMLVGARAADRLRASLDDPASYYDIDVQTAAMPWGQPFDVALATPRAAQGEMMGHGMMAMVQGQMGGAQHGGAQPLSLDLPVAHDGEHAGHGGH